MDGDRAGAVTTVYAPGGPPPPPPQSESQPQQQLNTPASDSAAGATAATATAPTTTTTTASPAATATNSGGHDISEFVAASKKVSSEAVIKHVISAQQQIKTRRNEDPTLFTEAEVKRMLAAAIDEHHAQTHALFTETLDRLLTGMCQSLSAPSATDVMWFDVQSNSTASQVTSTIM